MPRLNLFRVALHDVDILYWHLQGIGGNLCQHGRVPVTLAHRTRVQCCFAARIDRNARALPTTPIEAGSREAARRGHAAHIGVGSNANAAIMPGAA